MHWKDWSWSWSFGSSILATWWDELTHWKNSDAGKDRRQEEKGTTEEEMVGWHHRLNGHEFERAPGISDGQGGLACCRPWGHRESDTAERLDWAELALCSVMSDSLQSLCCSRQTPLSMGFFRQEHCQVGWHFLLQGVFPTQGSHLHLLCLLHCRQILYMLSPWGSPYWSSAIPIFQRFVCDSFSL